MTVIARYLFQRSVLKCVIASSTYSSRLFASFCYDGGNGSCSNQVSVSVSHCHDKWYKRTRNKLIWHYGERSISTGATHHRTLDGISREIAAGVIKNVIVLTGAGVSTASGLPDFRSPGSGLYDTLDDHEISHPMDIFDISFFDLNPRPFYRIAKYLHPANYKPNYCHYFIKLLLEKNLLLRTYTQNIDGLERKAGIPEDKLIEAHGSFATATCRICKTPYKSSDIETAVLKQQVPQCHDNNCQGVIKPDVVFFGENLPRRFFIDQVDDFRQCDLLIVMGTSLQVYPFASLADQVSSSIPRILINNEVVGSFGSSTNDILEIGDIIQGLKKFTKYLGWENLMDKFLLANNRAI